MDSERPEEVEVRLRHVFLRETALAVLTRGTEVILGLLGHTRNLPELAYEVSIRFAALNSVPDSKTMSGTAGRTRSWTHAADWGVKRDLVAS